MLKTLFATCSKCNISFFETVFMALRVPVFEKGRYRSGGSNCCYRIPFKLNSFQILLFCIKRVISLNNRSLRQTRYSATSYYIYNTLQEETAIDGPHSFPEPIPLSHNHLTTERHIAFNHKARTIYILNREGHLLGFHIDTQSLHTLSRSDSALSHLRVQ